MATCPKCGKTHRRLPVSCITTHGRGFSDTERAEEMGKYLHEAGFWNEFAGAVDALGEALKDASKSRLRMARKGYEHGRVGL